MMRLVGPEAAVWLTLCGERAVAPTFFFFFKYVFQLRLAPRTTTTTSTTSTTSSSSSVLDDRSGSYGTAVLSQCGTRPRRRRAVENRFVGA